MNSISFTHAYPKLLNDVGEVVPTATLLGVHVVNLSELSPEYISYDTDRHSFTLPAKGKYLMLIFLKVGYMQKTDLFTSLRLYELGKHEFYCSNIGTKFIIKIKYKG